MIILYSLFVIIYFKVPSIAMKMILSLAFVAILPIQFNDCYIIKSFTPSPLMKQHKLQYNIRNCKYDFNANHDCEQMKSLNMIDKKNNSQLEIQKEENSLMKNKYLIPVLALVSIITIISGVGHYVDIDALFESAVNKIEDLGPYGYFYFALIYITAEIFAIPAVPLTASSGYLFGLLPGTLVVLSSATIAATISFFIGRTFLRTWAQEIISSDSKWKAIDKAIGKEGFKVILLLRLSPLLPFALSNYLYGVTSVDFLSYISATFLGFAPGSFAFVYFGTAGKALFDQSGVPTIPWYAYPLIGGLVFLGAKTIGKIATDAIEDMELEDKNSSL